MAENMDIGLFAWEERQNSCLSVWAEEKEKPVRNQWIFGSVSKN
jgi:hypothetical protein